MPDAQSRQTKSRLGNSGRLFLFASNTGETFLHLFQYDYICPTRVVKRFLRFLRFLICHLSKVRRGV